MNRCFEHDIGRRLASRWLPSIVRFGGHLSLILLATLAVGVLGARAQEPEAPGGPCIEWLTLSTQADSPGDCGVTVHLTGSDSGTWIARARVGSSSTNVGPFHRLRLQGESLYYFHLAVPSPGSNELTLLLEEETGGKPTEVRIPFAFPEKGDAIDHHYLVPEIKLTGGDVRADWLRWELDTVGRPIVQLTVVDDAGTAIRSWPANMLQVGRTSILWDRFDDAGRSVSDGQYFLCVTEIGDDKDESRLLRTTLVPTR